MCDYSLAHVPNRLAVDGETLQVRRFGCSHGLGSARLTWREILFPGSRVAVCVPPGARLRLTQIPESLQRQLEVSSREVVTFVQQTAEEFRYRDAVRFANGREILLQLLHPGQRVEVLTVACVEDVSARPEARMFQNIHR